MAEPLLEVRGLTAGFDAGPVLFEVDLDVAAGELVALVGANGAGKSTLLGVLSGLVPSTAGSVRFGGRDVTNARPEAIVAAGLVHVPQGRRLFGGMSVEKNLLLGAHLRRDRDVRGDLEREARNLSGGEQQMVAIGRGLMGRPRLLMIDEPSLGLAPKVVERVIEVAGEISREGIAVLLVEQDVVMALDAAARAYVLESGRIALSGPADEIERDPAVRRAYLGL